MFKINKLSLLLLLPALLAGCSSITNLTPASYPRDPSNYYRVEAMWKTKKTVIQPESLRPEVVLDSQTYPMRPVPLVEDRWEAFVPVPPSQGGVLYYYKFNYTKDTFGKPVPDSLVSPPYKMMVH